MENRMKEIKETKLNPIESEVMFEEAYRHWKVEKMSRGMKAVYGF